jgi:hypothetical protein
VPRRQQRRQPARKGAPNARIEESGVLDASACRVLAAHGGDAARIEALVRGHLRTSCATRPIVWHSRNRRLSHSASTAAPTASWSKWSGHSPW